MHLKDPNAFNHNIENVTAHFIELLTEWRELHDVSVKLQTTRSAPLRGRPHKNTNMIFKLRQIDLNG